MDRSAPYALIVLLAGCPGARAPSSSDAIVLRGPIYTMDPSKPRAAMAVIEHGKFSCVGACSIPEGARVLDVGSAVPGLADAHGHVASFGRTLENVDLSGAKDEDECVRRIAERAKTAKGWILARGWDQTRWPVQKMPTKDALSRAVPDHPVLAERVDGHAAWVNQSALDAAGIGNKTDDPPGGKILRGDGGEPSGVLVDNAADLVAGKVPPPTDEEIERALVRAMDRLVQVGLTSVHDAGVDRRTLEIYRKLATADRLPLRIDAMLDGQQPMASLREDMATWKRTPSIGRLTVRAVKLYADGAMGSRGALMFEPYADEPQTTGLAVTPQEELRKRIVEIAQAGFQPAVHAIGDRACAETLADFLEAKQSVPSLRPRIEHLQVLRPSDMHLLVESGAVASMQPTHATSDGPWAEQRLGHGTQRQKGAYAWRSVLSANVPLACGSDFPVESIDPRLGLFAAETRPWMPEQRLTRIDALRCFTSGAAFAEEAESHRGKIAVGFDADATAFSDDVMQITDVRASRTRHVIVGGRVTDF
jgi:hypothetical protein